MLYLWHADSIQKASGGENIKGCPYSRSFSRLMDINRGCVAKYTRKIIKHKNSISLCNFHFEQIIFDMWKFQIVKIWLKWKHQVFYWYFFSPRRYHGNLRRPQIRWIISMSGFNGWIRSLVQFIGNRHILHGIWGMFWICCKKKTKKTTEKKKLFTSIAMKCVLKVRLKKNKYSIHSW